MALPVLPKVCCTKRVTPALIGTLHLVCLPNHKCAFLLALTTFKCFKWMFWVYACVCKAKIHRPQNLCKRIPQMLFEFIPHCLPLSGKGKISLSFPSFTLISLASYYLFNIGIFHEVMENVYYEKENLCIDFKNIFFTKIGILIVFSKSFHLVYSHLPLS